MSGFDTFTHRRVITASNPALATTRPLLSTPEALTNLRGQIDGALADVEKRLAH